MTQEQAEAAYQAAEDALEAGFAEARGGDDADSYETERTAPSSSQAEAPAAGTIAGFTEDQIKQMFGRLHKLDELEQTTRQTRDQLFGKLGEFNRSLQQLQQQKGGVSAIDVKRLKRLSEYDPELAASLAEDLKELSLGGGGPAGPSREEIGQFVSHFVNNAVQQTRQQMAAEYETKLLKTQHGDVEQTVNSPDFKAWVAAQDATTRHQIWNSNDGLYLSRKLGEFKQWRDGSSSAQSSSKQDRLRRAAAPGRTTAPATHAGMTDDDAFLAGFRAVRGQGLR
ncbi:MAG: hypothetical protein HQL47_07210 [Gammaproteobacteria bacterium]|nr:hypothetical protein [Gammaproteobacteria bacterium]